MNCIIIVIFARHVTHVYANINNQGSKNITRGGHFVTGTGSSVCSYERHPVLLLISILANFILMKLNDLMVKSFKIL